MTIASRALIVDDEPLARDGLRLMLDAIRCGRVGEAGEGTAAVKAIRTLRPDVVLLDVQMPGQSGFDVVERVAPDHPPLVVFVTARRVALRAFQVHAFDYLLKPVSQARLAEAMLRVRADLIRGAPGARARPRCGGRDTGRRRRTDRNAGRLRTLAVNRDRDQKVLEARPTWTGSTPPPTTCV